MELVFQIFQQTQYCFWHFAAMVLFMVHLEKRNRTAIKVAVVVALLLAYCWISSLASHLIGGNFPSMRWFFSTFLVNTVACKYICKISWIEAFYCAINGIFTEHLSSSLYILLFSSNGIIPGINWNYLYGLVNLVVYLLVYFVVARRLADNGHYSVGWGTVAVFTGAGLSIAFLLSSMVKRCADGQNTYDIYDVSLRGVFQLCQVYAVCVCVLMLLLQMLNHRDQLAQRRIATNKNVWQQRQEQYKIYQENIDLINRKCHDLKHQIGALIRAEGSDPERERFVKEVQDTIEIYDCVTDTDNEILNTILTQRSLYCKMHGVQWTCVADGSMLGFLDNMDLYALMGNALDNALESVEKITDPNRRIINLQIGRKDQFLMIRLENSFEGKIQIKHGIPVTSKKDKENHGFGVRSIRALAEKYGGSTSILTEDHTFVLKILIPLSERTKRPNSDAKITD